jgi:hypothetical protein
MSHALESIVLILVFAASIIKEVLTPKYVRTYWAIMSVCLVIGVANQVWERVEDTRRGADDARSKALDSGRESVERTRDIINDGLNNNDVARIESAFDDLVVAKETLRPYASSVPDAQVLLVIASDDLAVGRERQAYEGAKSGCRYWVENARVKSSRVDSGPDMTSMNMPYRKEQRMDLIKCTDIANREAWSAARKEYDSLYATLSTLFTVTDLHDYHRRDEIVSAARNLGYFQVCDRLRAGQPSDKRAKAAWELARRISESQMSDRNREIRAKLELLQLLDDGVGGDVSCSNDCPEWLCPPTQTRPVTSAGSGAARN